MSKNKIDKRELMLKQPVSKAVLSMAVPTVIAFAINSIYSLTDTYFVSTIGTNATAAVSVNSSLDSFIFLLSSAFAVGSGSFISRLLGANDKKKAESVLSIGLFSGISLGILILLFGSLFMTPMVKLLGATDTSIDFTIQYATYVLIAAPFTDANLILNQTLRSEGAAKISFIGTALGAVINMGLDPVFIYSMNLGVTGASMATAISKFITFAILIVPYIFKRTMLNLSIRKFRFNLEIYKEIFRVGGSSSIRGILQVISGIILNHLAGGFSDAVLAGIGVTNKIMMLPFNIILGFSSGLQPVIGFNWGAKNFERVKKAIKFATIVGVLGSAVMAAIIVIFANQLFGLFTTTDAESTKMLEIGTLCLTLQAITLPAHTWSAIINGSCAGAGYGFGALIMSTSRQGTCFLPFVFPLTALFGEYGIASAQAFADVVTLILCVVMLKKIYNMINKKIAENEVSAV